MIKNGTAKFLKALFFVWILGGLILYIVFFRSPRFSFSEPAAGKDLTYFFYTLGTEGLILSLFASVFLPKLPQKILFKEFVFFSALVSFGSAGYLVLLSKSFAFTRGFYGAPGLLTDAQCYGVQALTMCILWYLSWVWYRLKKNS